MSGPPILNTESVSLMSLLANSSGPRGREFIQRLRRRNWIVLPDQFLIASISIAVFAVFARFDPDPHHDGFQIAPAIGVHDGKFMHSEIYSHYGPVSAWINGAWLNITEPTLLSLRLFGAVQLSLTAVLLYALSAKLGLARSASWLIAIVWIISCPVWAYESNYFGLWLWPSITFNLLALAVALLVIQNSHGSFREGKEKRKDFVIGVLLGLALLVRTKEGFVLLVAFFVVLVSVQSSSRLLRAVFGFVVTLFVFSTALVVTGSFHDWLIQTVLGPLRNPESVSVGGFDWNYFKGIYLKAESKIHLGLLAALIGLFYSYHKLATRNSQRIAILLISAVVGYYAVRTGSVTTRITSLSSATDTSNSVLAYTMLIRFGLIFSLAGIGLVTVRLIGERYVKKVWATATRQQELLVTLALALAAVANLYPLPDVYHLWWASPSLILFVMVLIKSFLTPKFGRAVINVMLLLVVVVVPVNTLKAFNEIQQPRVMWSTGLLKGMLIHENIVSSFLLVDEVLEQLDHPADFSTCRDPLWAVFSGKYMSINEFYSMPPVHLASPPKTGLIVDCGQDVTQRRSSLISLREIVSTPGYLNSFSPFASIDKIVLSEVTVSGDRP